MANIAGRDHLGRFALLGALVGLGIGLFVWAWSATHPAGAPAGLVVATAPHPAMTTMARPGSGVLGEEDAPAPAASTTATAAATTAAAVVTATAPASPTESPRATGVRFVWSSRFLENDFAGALMAINDAKLEASERDAQLAELADALLQQDWIDKKTYPVSRSILTIYHQPFGRDLLARRWDAARHVVSALAVTPQKVRFLTRLELYAQMLREAPSHSEQVAAARPLPALREVDEAQRPLAPQPTPKIAPAPAIIDYPAESKAIASELQTALMALDPTPVGHSWTQVAGLGWGIVRTALFSVAGALLTAVGSVLVKSYAELIAGKISHLPLLGAASLGGSHPGAEAEKA